MDAVALDPLIMTVGRAARSGVTGELSWAGEDVDTRVFLRRGRVAWAMRSGSDFSFGRELARRARIEPSVLREVVAKCRREGVPLQGVLVRDKHAELEEIRDAMRLQIRDALGPLATRSTVPSIFVPHDVAASSGDDALTFAFEEVADGALVAGSRASREVFRPQFSGSLVEVGVKMANVKDVLAKVMEIDGALGCCVVDSNSGLMLGSAGGGASVDLELAAAGNTEVVRAKRRTMLALGLDDKIDDMLITLGRQYHVIRPLAANDAFFLYLVLDKVRGNLAMARHQLVRLEGDLAL